MLDRFLSEGRLEILLDHKEEKDASKVILLHDAGDFLELAWLELVIGVGQPQQELLELIEGDVISLGGEVHYLLIVISRVEVWLSNDEFDQI